MGPLSYMRSVVDRDVGMWRMTVLIYIITFNHEWKQKLYDFFNCGLIPMDYNYKSILVFATLKMVTCVP